MSGANFDDYCNYILPYRIQNEAITTLPTADFEARFSSICNLLKNKELNIEAVTNFIVQLNLIHDISLNRYYPNILSPLVIDELRVSPRCEDLAIYITLIFRSLGIPAAINFIPHWGDHHSLGHSWAAIKWNDRWYGFEVGNGKLLNITYNKYVSIPKIYAGSSVRSYDLIDVTNDYIKTTKLKVTIDSKDDKNKHTPAIAVYDKFNGYSIVDYGSRENNKYVFENMGCSVVYFVGVVSNNGFSPLTSPIFIDSDGSIKELTPKYHTLEHIVLERKYPLIRSASQHKKMWCKSLNGACIEASNDNFKSIDTLVLFNDYDSFKEEQLDIPCVRAYSQVRIRFKKNITHSIATLSFLDPNDVRLEGALINNLPFEQQNDIHKMFDSNILSYISVKAKNDEQYIGYDFSEPKYISSVVVQTRNDGNSIVAGNEYELMVWDKGEWQSLDTDKAVAQRIIFYDVPIGGFYLLKNLTEGVEELPFMLDEDNNQLWNFKR